MKIFFFFSNRCFVFLRRSSIEKLLEVIDKLMSRRDEIDPKENGIDNQHDLPVYHRIQRLLNNFTSHINQFNPEKINEFRLFSKKILLFDRTFASLLGTLFIRISKTKEEIEEFFQFFEKNLPSNYFRRLLTQFGTFFIKENSSPFLEQLNLQEKIQLVQWFIEKNRILFIWDLLQEQILNQTNIDRQIAKNFIQQIRSTDDLFLRQQAMEYTVPWNQDKTSD